MEKHLQNEEAKAKFKKLTEEIRVCMFITNNKENNHTRPMATIQTDEDGTLWFFTDVRSIKVEEVNTDNSIHLVYAHPGKESYLDVWGRADVITDRQQIKDKWSPIVKAWFPNGSDDPNLALLKVTPGDCYYWDSETGKMVAFAKIAAAAITGTRLSEGKEGALKL
jgi:general stress protein 26